MDLEKICKSTIEAVELAGKFIKEELDNTVNEDLEEKGRHNFVTYVDKEAERILVDRLGQILPEAGFITEEGTIQKSGEKYNWIIDPLDGTTNFIHGAFPFAVSVALSEDSQPIAGVILELGFNECFYGWKGGGAYLNGRPIRVSSNKTLHDSLIATGFPYSTFDKMNEFLLTLNWFIQNTRGLRRLGSAATDIAWVAAGRYEGFYEKGLNAWDVAAGVIILTEAGGKSTDFTGGNDYLFGNEIVCSNGSIHGEFVNVIKGIMKM